MYFVQEIFEHKRILEEAFRQTFVKDKFYNNEEMMIKNQFIKEIENVHEELRQWYRSLH